MKVSKAGRIWLDYHQIHSKKNMGIKEVMTVPRSPWQNPFVEGLIGSIRRNCLDRTHNRFQRLRSKDAVN